MLGLLSLTLSLGSAAFKLQSVPFKPERISRSGSFDVAYPVEKVFPLFEPLGEKKWSPDWDPKAIYPADLKAAKGTVFTVSHASGANSVWTITRYESPHVIEYLRVLPKSHVAAIKVECEAEGKNGTRVTVSYEVTSLTAHGKEFLDQFASDPFPEEMKHWGAAVGEALRRG